MGGAKVVGRFAPTPSGRMHLGNVFAALIAWASVRSQDGEMVLRMEDLDTQRTSADFAAVLRDDLRWLGLDYDRETPPQSRRSDTYDRYFEMLREKGLIYPCYCTRSQLHSVNAPHLSDGTYVYTGTCRNLTEAERAKSDRKPAWRCIVPDKLWSVEDLVQGHYELNLYDQCGDMVMRRADGVYVYQLAVTVDDGEAGVTEVVRGMDLLSSANSSLKATEKGTAFHRFMQYIDLDNFNVEEQIKALYDKGVLSFEEMHSISKEDILKFLNSNLVSQMRKSKNVCREYRFLSDIKAQDYTDISGEDKNIPVLIQGVIDMFYEDENGDIVLVDYKTDRSYEEVYFVSRYTQQLKLYAYALEKILKKRISKCIIYAVLMGKEIEV